MLQRSSKPRGIVVCGDCDLVLFAGRWQRSAAPSEPWEEGLCPACQRVRDRYPAGTLILPKEFLTDREEILHLIRHLAATEQAEHPLERLMGMEDRAGQLVVTTAGVHLARQIAHKLAKRFHCKPHLRYAEDENLVFVTWGQGAQATGPKA